MSKSSKKIKTILMLPCMCSIAFYLGSQVVTYTEASFVNETKIQSAISTAIVFPKTIDTLTKEAVQHERSILNAYEEMLRVGEPDSVAALQQQEKVWKQQHEKMKPAYEALQKIYTEIEGHYNQAVESTKNNKSESSQQVLQYVQAGFTAVKSIRDNVDKQVNLQQIDEKIVSLQKQIEEEAKKASKEQQEVEKKTQAEQVASSSQTKEEIQQQTKSSSESIKQSQNTEQDTPAVQQKAEKKEEIAVKEVQ
ncbi:DUF4047 domain-containing protein [Bacillus sp. DX1.1]|uniref:DUF4047 domain-containing protein n=1 Tax=unclassified Bacillus (in: firmicutes) TaxID=185979 RepID=UPI00256FA6C8|nr:MULTISPECIES: DUF4047 domain-containing protein [unclassified Bacillus (in: firmicutes)]MDM5153907.1 DUF4047 domain-containing protein [Bacillus sp. DX1.1]WJE82841.1 DUF4047 domain-containing protein [Bacillus sp. DX3.1]